MNILKIIEFITRKFHAKPYGTVKTNIKKIAKSTNNQSNSSSEASVQHLICEYTQTTNIQNYEIISSDNINQEQYSHINKDQNSQFSENHQINDNQDDEQDVNDETEIEYLDELNSSFSDDINLESVDQQNIYNMNILIQQQIVLQLQVVLDVKVHHR